MLVKRKTLYSKLLGSLIKKGHKRSAKICLDKAFEKSWISVGSPLKHIYGNVFSKLSCRVELKKVRRGRNFYMVPFPIPSSRQDFLKIKWILDDVKLDNRQVAFSEKLFAVMSDVLVNKKSKVILQRKNVLKDAKVNKANAHFRW